MDIASNRSMENEYFKILFHNVIENSKNLEQRWINFYSLWLIADAFSVLNLSLTIAILAASANISKM